MNAIERAKAGALARCTLLPGSWDKRFVRNLAWLARHDPGAVLTPRQRLNLDRLVWRYRRQLAGRDDLGFDMPAGPPPEPEASAATAGATPGQERLF